MRFTTWITEGQYYIIIFVETLENTIRKIINSCGFQVENMAALCLLNTDWYGFIYSYADTKKKSNLMLTIMEHGSNSVPWLGNLRNLGPVDAKKQNEDISGFPVKPIDKKSYSQNAPSWIREVGLQSDIQKLLRHARKLPEKTQNFYKVFYHSRILSIICFILYIL